MTGIVSLSHQFCDTFMHMNSQVHTFGSAKRVTRCVCEQLFWFFWGDLDPGQMDEQLEPQTSRLSFSQNTLFSLYLPQNIFSECFSQAWLGTVGMRCGGSLAPCLSPGCLLGFQGSGSHSSEPEVTLTFSSAVGGGRHRILESERLWEGEI